MKAPRPEILAAAATLLGVDPERLSDALQAATDERKDPVQLLRPKEFAKLAKLHEVSVRRLLRLGCLPGVKINGAWRLPVTALECNMPGKGQ